MSGEGAGGLPQRVALFGGSFDPPHIGHALVATYVLGLHPVDRVLVVPADAHPFSKPLSPFADRLHMCRLAMAHLRDVEVCDIAGQLAGEGHTLPLLHALRGRYPDAAFRLVMGWDLLPETPRWHRFDEVARLAPPLVVPRGGHSPPIADDGQPLPALPEVSSTVVRQRLRDGLSVDRMVQADVAAYARAQDLYAGA